MISTDVLASYAADAAREVEGVRGLVESALHRQRGVQVEERDGVVSLELERRNRRRQLDDFATHGYWGYATVEGGQAVVKALTGTREPR